MKSRKSEGVDLLQGTLDLLVLRTLLLGPMHGHGIGKMCRAIGLVLEGAQG